MTTNPTPAAEDAVAPTSEEVLREALRALFNASRSYSAPNLKLCFGFQTLPDLDAAWLALDLMKSNAIADVLSELSRLRAEVEALRAELEPRSDPESDTGQRAGGQITE